MKKKPSRAYYAILLITLLLIQRFVIGDALFGSEKRKEKREAELLAAKLAAEDAARIDVLGFKISRNNFCVFSVALVGIWTAFLSMKKTGTKKRGNRSGVAGTIDVVVVGCGLPKKSMGWYHLTQLLEMPTVNVRAVVEPFFMNEQLCKEKPQSFRELEEKISSLGVEFVAEVGDLKKFARPTMCLIAGRTPDNPKLFSQCIEKGPKCIYLEKPGAPTAKELKDMKYLAEGKHCKVFVGYNKNVTPYVHRALDLARKIRNSHVFFCHNNAYSQMDLPEVFVRNSEGMLKNMAVHELALLVTFFGATVDTIAKFKVNTGKLFSEKLTVWKPSTSMPNPEYITDFSRVAFKITTKSGINVSVMADRCGGNVSFAVVKDENGVEVKKFEYPDPELYAKVRKQTVEDPDMMPYFFIQSDDYLELKNRIINSLLNDAEAKDVATIDIAIEALRLAEYCTNKLNEALKAA